jgi:hypothetical protein
VDFTVMYSRAVALKTLRFIEGGAHSNLVGYFRKVTPQVLVNGSWQDLPASASRSARITSAPYQIIDWTLPEALSVTAIRLSGTTVGGFASIIELDALSEPAGMAPPRDSSVRRRTAAQIDETFSPLGMNAGPGSSLCQARLCSAEIEGGHSQPLRLNQ